MTKVKPGRPALPMEQRQKPNKALQVRLSDEHHRAYRERMGRDVFIDLLELPEDRWRRVLDILKESE